MSFFLLALLITGILYHSATSVIQDYAADSAMSLLAQTRDSIDHHIRQADGLIDRLAQDYNVQAFLSVKHPLKDTDYDSLRNLFVKLPYADMDNYILHRLFVYFPNSGVVVNSSVASSRLESMYNYYFRYEDMDVSQWRSRVLGEGGYFALWPAQTVHVEGEAISALTYVRSIINLYDTGVDGYVIALVDENVIKESLNSSLMQNAGASYILDEQGRKVTGVDHSGLDFAFSDETISGTGSFRASVGQRDVLVIHTASAVNGWRYVSLIPIKVLMEPVNAVTRTFLIILCAGFFIWCAVALFMAGRNSRPIRDIVRTINAMSGDEPGGRRNEFDFISGTIADLVHRNEDLASDLSRQEELIKNTFFQRLLQNHFVDQDEMQTHMDHAKIALTGASYQVMLVKISGYYDRMTSDMFDEMENSWVLSRSLMIKCLGSGTHFYRVSEDSIAVVLCIEEDFDAKEASRRMQGELSSYKIVASIGVGTRYSYLMELWQSFDEAKKALNNCSASGGIYFYEQAGYSSDEYAYPIQTEIRLINLVKLGENKGVVKLLDDLEAENFQKRNLSPEKAVLFVGELLGTAIKLKDELVCQNMGNDDRIREIAHVLARRMPEQALAQVRILLQQMAGDVLALKEKRKSDLSKEMLDYIEQNYADQDLCLYSAASHFNLMEKYFSRYFKEQTGENFSACIEKTRMRKTKEMLDGSDLPLVEIAKRTGYINMNTFYKAFRRTFGVSPSDYRRSREAGS
ncbi:MAG: helix-turn-helix domain-containing protein [Christensenellales bacterium]